MPGIFTSISVFFKFVNISYLIGDNHFRQSSEIFGSLQKFVWNDRDLLENGRKRLDIRNKIHILASDAEDVYTR